MHETLKLDDTVTAVEPETAAAADYYPEYVDPGIDDSELFNLVAQNAAAIVSLGGLKMTLSEAMWQIPINGDNMPQVIATVYQLLANQEEQLEKKAEEPEKKEAVAEETAAEEATEEDRPEETAEAQQEIIPEKNTEKTSLKESESVQAKTADPENRQGPVTQQVAQNPADISQPAAVTREVKPTAPAPISPVEAVAALSVAVTEAKPAAPAVSPETTQPLANEAAAGKPATSAGSTGEYYAARRSVAEELEAVRPASQSEAKAGPVAKVKADELTVEPPPEIVSQVPPLPKFRAERIAEEVEAAAEPAAAEPVELALDFESEDAGEPVMSEEPLAIAPEMLELPELPGETVIPADTTETAEEELEVLLDYQFNIDDLANGATEVFVIEHAEEIAPEPDEQEVYFEALAPGSAADSPAAEESPIPALALEPAELEPVETSLAELPQTGVAINEVENCLALLDERINESVPETVEAVNATVEKIVEVMARFELQEADPGTEVEAELAELFTELLDKIGVAYTPELIESLTYLTFKGQMAEAIERFKKEEVEEIPDGRGTHEIIKKILRALSVIKKAIAHASAIGKSALRLYSFNIALAA